MISDFVETNENRGLLSGAFEVQQGTSIRKRIADLQPCPIPTRALVVMLAGIDGIPRIEAVRQRDNLPARMITGALPLPDLPGTAK